MRTTIFNVVKTTLNDCDFFGSEFFFVSTIPFPALDKSTCT